VHLERQVVEHPHRVAGAEVLRDALEPQHDVVHVGHRCGAADPAESGSGVEQLLRVRVLGCRGDVGRPALLHDAALGHDDQVIGAIHRDAEVVRDQQQRGAGVGHQPVEVVEDAALDRGVERARRLVGDEQTRPARERDRDQHALALSTGQLVRVLPSLHRRVVDACALEHLGHLGGHRTPRDTAASHRLGDLLADAQGGVESHHGVLGDETDERAAVLTELPVADRRDVVAAEQDATADDATAGGKQTEGGVGGRGLARARLADQRHDLAGADREGQVLDHDALAPLGTEADGQAFDRQDVLALTCLGGAGGGEGQCHLWISSNVLPMWLRA
jgi:hypothetical protein